MLRRRHCGFRLASWAQLIRLGVHASIVLSQILESARVIVRLNFGASTLSVADDQVVAVGAIIELVGIGGEWFWLGDRA